MHADEPPHRPLRVVLTGATGELGLALGNALVAAGADVLGIDIRPADAARFPVQIQDLRRRPLDAAQLAGRELVVHFAGHARPDTAPAEVVLADNAACDRAVLEVAAGAPAVRTIIAASSCFVFSPIPVAGREPHLPPYLPIDGHVAPAPNTPYGESKVATETLLRELAARDPERAFVALRLPRVVTPRQERHFFRWPLATWGLADGFAFLPASDLGPLVVAIARAGLRGYRSYFPAARENTQFLPARKLVRQRYATVPLRQPLAALESLVDNSEITRDTGWSPRPVANAERALSLLRLALEQRLQRRLPNLGLRVRRLVDGPSRRLRSPPILGTARLVADAGATLGEGPFWHATEGALYWVDIPGQALHRFRPGRGDEVMPLAEWPTAVFAGPGREVLVALRDRLVWVDFDARTMRPHAVGIFEASPNRLNDGKHDPRGRLWIGSMHFKGERRTGALFRVDGGEVTRVLEGVGCSNGLAWSADGATMYYVDSHDRGIDAFDYDLTRGTATRRRRVFSMPRWMAGPDGLCIDAEGCLWVALHGGGAVLRVDPRAGSMLAQVQVPCPLVTSCAFGGPDLSTLYITTAAGDGRPGGGLFAFDTPVKGAPVPGAGASTLP